MEVIKRDGTKEKLDVNKVHQCIEWACEDLENVSVSDVETNAHVQFFNGITTQQIHSRMIQSAAELISIESPDYEYVAARLLLQQIMKECDTDDCHDYPSYVAKAVSLGKLSPEMLSHYDLELDNDRDSVYEAFYQTIDNSRNLKFKYLGLQTLYDRYLIRDNDNKVIESPQHFFMRVACGICLNEPKEGDVAAEKAIELYDLYSNFEFMSSTPTLFNSGTLRPQMSSCFLLTVDDSTIEHNTESEFGKGIMALMAECAVLSKYAGGIGTDFTRIRPVGSLIKGTSGISSGVIPYLKIYNSVAAAFNQSGKRPGSFASYLEPWHADIEAYIDVKKPTGDQRLRAMDIFPYLWMNDLFLERVQNKQAWSLFDVSKYPELHELYGDAFKARYEELESQKAYIKQIDAMELWVKSVTSLAETGAPMICFKDEANRRNPQRHVGVIKSSNLCVAHDTQVLTDEGYRTISAMVGQFVNVWNGEEFSNVEIIKTGENQKLLKVTTTTGNSLECTAYHKFYVIEGTEVIEKRTSELKQGDSLLPFNSPSELVMGYAVSHIESVVDEGLFGDTYCFNEPKRHLGVFNGLLTGNCSEIFEVTSDEETAVCNLGSLNFANLEFDDIKRAVPIAIRALDNVIDLNFYPSDKAKTSNTKHRPVGLGVMGWAEYLVKHDIDFESQEHLDECDRIWSEISYWAIHTSCELAKEKGQYSSFEGSDWSKGVLPYTTSKQDDNLSSEDYLYWNSLAAEVKEYGVRNSLMLALAPTATISTILGTTPSIEVAYKLSYIKDNLSGKFMVIDPTLRYNKPVITKSAFEIDQVWSIKAAAVRQKWIDQGQSLNLYKAIGTRGSTISNWFMLACELGLKSTYYLKNQDESVKVDNMVAVEEEVKFCSIDNPECESCS